MRRGGPRPYRVADEAARRPPARRGSERSGACEALRAWHPPVERWEPTWPGHRSVPYYGDDRNVSMRNCGRRGSQGADASTGPAVVCLAADVAQGSAVAVRGDHLAI